MGIRPRNVVLKLFIMEREITRVLVMEISALATVVTWCSAQPPRPRKSYRKKFVIKRILSTRELTVMAVIL